MNIRDYMNKYRQLPVSHKALSNINTGTLKYNKRIYLGSPKSDRIIQNYRSIDTGSPVTPSAFTVRKKSLPPIIEERKRQMFDL